MNVPRVVLLIFGIIFALTAIGYVFAGGSVLAWSHSNKSDGGFLKTERIELKRDSHAVVTERIDIDENAGAFLRWFNLDTIVIECSARNSSKRIFLGIGKADEVEEYLRDVEHDEIRSFDLFPTRIKYSHVSGSREPDEPRDQDFWILSDHGKDSIGLEWEIGEGEYRIVLMNEDASKTVESSLRVGMKVLWFFRGIGFLTMASGLLGLLGSIVMIVLSIYGRKTSNFQTPVA